jgi:hypothetical protein
MGERSPPDRTPTKGKSTMQRPRLALLAAVITVIAGLALGAGMSEADTSIANTASKLLLTVGAVSLIAALAVILIGHLRTRRSGHQAEGRAR